MKHYDFVIAGGGLAGLSLACQLTRSPLADRSILIVDHDDKDLDDRTFSFWTDGTTLFDAAVCRSWQRMRIAGPGVNRCQDLGAYRYKTIRGGDFYRCARSLLAGRPSVEFLHGHIDRIEDGQPEAMVFLDDRTVTGSWVFDSILDAPSQPSGGAACLDMTFVGWEVETSQDVFDPDVVTFMDFRTPQEDDLRFLYVLPFAGNRALVDHTAFTAARIPSSEARAALDGYLREVIGVRDYRFTLREGGCLAVTDGPFPRRLGERVMAVGIKGGRLKPTTGYAFTRVQVDSAAIVASLVVHGHPFGAPHDARSFRWLDHVMLRVMARHGGDMHAIMETLFEKNPIERVLSFLDETATPLSILQLMATLPRAKFMEAALLNRR